MTPREVHSELIHVAAELVRGLHEDIVFSKTTPWYVRERVRKVIDDADERSRALAMRLKTAADTISTTLRADKETRTDHAKGCNCDTCKAPFMPFEAGP